MCMRMCAVFGMCMCACVCVDVLHTSFMRLLYVTCSARIRQYGLYARAVWSKKLKTETETVEPRAMSKEPCGWHCNTPKMKHEPRRVCVCVSSP